MISNICEPVADYWHDPQMGGLCDKIPERLLRSTGFFVPIPQPRKRASGYKQKIPPSLCQGGILLRSVAESNYLLLLFKIVTHFT